MTAKNDGWAFFVQNYFRSLSYTSPAYSSRIKFEPEAIEFVKQQYKKVSERQFRHYCLQMLWHSHDLLNNKIEPSSQYSYSVNGSEKVIPLTTVQKLLHEIYK